MIRLVLVLVALAAVAAAPAAAKGPIEVEICGASECREIRWAPHEPSGSDRFSQLVVGLVNAGQSFAFTTTPALSPYYRVELRSPGMHFAPLHVVPSAGVAERSRSWIWLRLDLLATFRRAVAGLEPLPRPRIERALVNGRPSGSAEVYEGVFGPRTKVDAPPTGTPSAEIRLVTDRPSPWTEGRGTLLYYPTLDVLRRPSEWVEAPPELAERIEADLASVRQREGGASVPLLASSLALALGLGAVTWMTLARRRRARPT